MLLSAAPVAAAAKVAENEPQKQTTFKPQELPIYTTIFGSENKKLVYQISDTYNDKILNFEDFPFIFSFNFFLVHQQLISTAQLFDHQLKVVLK